MTRVVVVGHGMVGSRFVEDLAGRDPAAEITVLGAEEYEPYNRVLLSEVVAGKVDVASLTLPGTTVPGVRVCPGATVVALDPAARRVTTADGDHVGYDVLVLATGARARVPALAGLVPAASDATGDPGADGRPAGPSDGVAGGADGALPAGVHALRTLDDAREIVAATVNARRAVVLGGGVLGLEAACGLARRGLAVTVVHGGAHVMDRQLDGPAAEAVVHSLRGLGIDHRVAARAQGVDLDGDGRLRGLVLADGEHLPADLLVLTAGTVAETALAASGGLAVDRGIVVDGDLATSDPAVFAIGDCAQPPEGGTGLIAQGWDQARRLAAHLARRGSGDDRPAGGTATPDPAPTDVVRVKAHGLEIVTMGVSGSRAPDSCHRTVRLSDPSSGRHIEVVVADGVLVGATCVGAGPVAADLTTAYTRRTPVPRDPAQLLLRPVAGAGGGPAHDPSPTLMPDRATVCRCNGVTKGDLVGCWRGGGRSLEEVARTTRATTGCGGCTDAVCGILDWLGKSDPPAPAAVPAGTDGRGSAGGRPAGSLAVAQGVAG